MSVASPHAAAAKSVKLQPRGEVFSALQTNLEAAAMTSLFRIEPVHDPLNAVR